MEEGNRSCLEPLQESHPDRTVSITPSLPLMSLEVKTEAGRHEGDGQQLVDILPSSTTVSSHMQKSRKPHRTEQQVRGSLRSSGKHSVHLLQMKNARTLKPVLPQPSPSSPGIQRWHSCKECGKGFSFACQLEVHMRWHTKEKPYSCTVCRKSFTTVSMLKRHHRIHTGEKPFRCHVCGKCFNQSAHLNTHFRLHTRERASWSRTTGPSKTWQPQSSCVCLFCLLSCFNTIPWKISIFSYFHLQKPDWWSKICNIFQHSWRFGRPGYSFIDHRWIYRLICNEKLYRKDLKRADCGRIHSKSLLSDESIMSSAVTDYWKHLTIDIYPCIVGSDNTSLLCNKVSEINICYFTILKLFIEVKLTKHHLTVDT